LPVPLELLELARHVSPWRLGLLAINVAVLVYLARWLRRHHAGE